MCGLVSVRCAASVTYYNPCLWSLETRMRKPTNSATGSVSRMRWPRPTAGWHCAQSGIRGVVNLLGKVPDKQSVDKLECWVWDQVYTMSAIPVLSLAMCMVLDVVFPVNEKKMPPKLLGWCVCRKSVGSTWSGKASCGFALCSSTKVGMTGSSNVASKMAARSV